MEVKEILKKAHKAQEELNCFVTIIADAQDNKDYIAIKDNFSTKGVLSTASSNTLKNYIPFFDATVVEKLKEVGIENIGKTVMDELGMGSTGTTASTGVVKNPWDKTRITGGSSAGSAAVVAANVVKYALGSDTGDSIRKPAAWCGVVGYKPTYGLVSRYGLFAFASSLDTVGVISRNVKDAAMIIDTIKGQDAKDMTSWNSSKINLTTTLDEKVLGKKLFYIKEICDINEYSKQTPELKSIMTEFKNTLEKCKGLGIEVEEVSFDKDLLNAILPTYLSIACAEATSNCANLTGIAFGPRGEGKTAEEQMTNHRTLGFSPLIKRRFIIGSFVLQDDNQEKYFLNACRVRRIIVDKINDLFKKYDGMILPCSGSGAPKIEGNIEYSVEGQILENHMAIANFGGFPSITIPNGFVDGMPTGINITGKIKDDANILNIASSLEAVMEYKDQVAKGWE